MVAGARHMATALLAPGLLAVALAACAGPQAEDAPVDQPDEVALSPYEENYDEEDYNGEDYDGEDDGAGGGRYDGGSSYEEGGSSDGGEESADDAGDYATEVWPAVSPYRPSPKPALTPADWDAIAAREPYERKAPRDTTSRRTQALDPGLADGIGTVAWVIVVALLLGVLAFLIYRHRQRPDLSVTHTDYGTTDELLSATADELATGLETGLETRDFRKAIRLRFGQVLQTLRARGLLTWVPGNTNLDYERGLPTALREGFHDLSAEFSYATYAGRDIDEARYTRFAEAAESFLLQAHAPQSQAS